MEERNDGPGRAQEGGSETRDDRLQPHSAVSGWAEKPMPRNDFWSRHWTTTKRNRGAFMPVPKNPLKKLFPERATRGKERERGAGQSAAEVQRVHDERRLTGGPSGADFSSPWRTRAPRVRHPDIPPTLPQLCTYIPDTVIDTQLFMHTQTSTTQLFMHTQTSKP